MFTALAGFAWYLTRSVARSQAAAAGRSLRAPLDLARRLRHRGSARGAGVAGAPGAPTTPNAPSKAKEPQR